MRPNVSTQIQRTQGVRKGKTWARSSTPVDIHELPTSDSRMVAEVVDALVAGTECTPTANGDGTFTRVYSFPFESTV